MGRYLEAIEVALADMVKRDIAYAVSKREDEIRETLGLVELVVNIETDYETYRNEPIWCSKSYEGCKDYHIDTLIAGQANGDLVFLAHFKPISDLMYNKIVIK